MTIDLRNIKSSNSYPESNISVQSHKAIIKDKVDVDSKSSLKEKSNISRSKTKIYQWILVFYSILFLALLSVIVLVDWSNIWQLPKSTTFIFGLTGLFLLSSIFWIFGFIKHSVKINLGDIFVIIFGITTLILSFLSPNITAFWGSSMRIFDSGLFIGFLILFYLILKLLIEIKFIKVISLSFAIILLISEIITVILIYIPDILSPLSILTKLQPSNSWLTESPQELVFISLLVFNIIFIILSKINPQYKLYVFLSFIYYIAGLLHILILIRLPDYAMYALTIVTLIINTFIHISRLLQNRNNENLNKRLTVSRLSFGYGVLIIILIALMIIRPFQNNSKFPEYATLTVPNFSTSLSIAKKSLQTDTLFGSGNIMYAWNKFTPAVTETQITDFSFETLYSEIFNLVVRNGIVSVLILIILAIWIIGVVVRMLLLYKKIPIETYILFIAIIGLFLIPFTVITKILLILTLLMWSNVISQYFKPVININLDINKIPSSVLSLFTFTILFCLAGLVLVCTRFYNIIRSQEYIVEAVKIGENSTEQLDLLRQASIKSPYIIEYAHLYIPAFIQQINKQALELSNNSKQTENRNIDLDKQKLLQDNINDIQKNIDDYKKRFPSDSRVIYWQLDLYSVINNYSNVKETDYLPSIDKGRELQPNTISWDIYEAQYYAKQAQKAEELNMEQFNKSKDILYSLVDKNPYNIEVYKNYYDLLSLSKDYKEQINILNKYINLTIEKNLVADQSLVYSLALAYQNDKQYDKAILYYNKLLEAFPEYANVYFKLGEIYEIEKKSDLAKQNYQKVLELDPNAEAAKLKLDQLK